METPTGTGTTGTYIDLYLRDLGRLVDAGERQPITLRLYEDSARHHLVLLRECPLELLTVAQLRDWHFTVAQMARDSGWHTVKTGAGAANRALVLLGLVLRRAEEDGAIARGSSPTRYLKRFSERPRERYLTDVETAALWKAIGSVEKMTVRHARRPKDLAYSPFQALRLILLLGLRKTEALALRWDSVDLAGRVLRFKSKTGYREVAVSTSALELLQQQQARRINEWVFPSRSCEGKHVALVYPLWRKIVDVSGIDPTGVVIHTVRHGLATCAIRRGENLEHVSSQLGHKNSKVTKAVYSRPLATPGMRALVERHDAIITGRAA